MIDWSDGLTEKERKAVGDAWLQYYPFNVLPPQVPLDTLNILLRRLSSSAPHLHAIGQKMIRKFAGIVAEAQKQPTLPHSLTSQQGDDLVATKEQTTKEHKGNAAAPPAATLQAQPKPLSAEDQAKLDAEINAGLGGKGKKAPKDPNAPAVVRSGAAPGGLTWVQWFREVIAGGTAPKDAEAQYIELRKGEPAYSGDGGDKKLKRHAYHHRVLAMEASKSPAA